MTPRPEAVAATMVAVDVVRGHLDDEHTGAWRALDGVDERADLIEVAEGVLRVLDAALRHDAERVLRLLEHMPRTPAVLVAAHQLRGHTPLARRRLERATDPAAAIVGLAELLVDVVLGRDHADALRPLLGSMTDYLTELAGDSAA